MLKTFYKRKKKRTFSNLYFIKKKIKSKVNEFSFIKFILKFSKKSAKIKNKIEFFKF